MHEKQKLGHSKDGQQLTSFPTKPSQRAGTEERGGVRSGGESHDRLQTASSVPVRTPTFAPLRASERVTKGASEAVCV